jgi:predicted ATP-grasp superfamily ATP-dependent carboligase
VLAAEVRVTHYSRGITPAVVCDAGKLSQVALIQELGRLRIPVIALSESESAIGFGSRYVKQKLVHEEPSHDPAFVRFLLSNVPRGVIFYSNDANTQNLALHQDLLRDSGFSLFVSDPDTLERVISKDKLYQTGSECGVSVPRSELISSAEELADKITTYSMPAILKATNLAGGIYRFIPTRECAHDVFRQMMDVIGGAGMRHRNAQLMIQQWVSQDYVELWNFNAIVRGGEIVSFCMGKRVRTDRRADGTVGSVLLFGESEYNGKIFEQNRRLFRHIKFDGLVETEWSTRADGAGDTYLYDFNPRPSGNIRWSFRSGASLAEDYYRLALGLAPSSRPMKTGTKYVKLFCRESDLLYVLGNRKLSGSERIKALSEDLIVLLGCRHHAVDILDLRDPGPTLRAVRELAQALGTSFRRRAAHLGQRRGTNGREASQ